MTEFKYPSAVYDVIAEFADEEQMAMALIIARKKLDIVVSALKRVAANYPRMTDLYRMKIANDAIEKINGKEKPCTKCSET